MAKGVVGVVLVLVMVATVFFSETYAIQLKPEYSTTVYENRAGGIGVWDCYRDKGLNTYLAAVRFRLEENSMALPVHFDSHIVAYVIEGTAKWGMVVSNGRSVDTVVLKAGDAFMIPVEMVSWFYNDHFGPFTIVGFAETSKAVHPGKIAVMPIAGSASLLHGFSDEVNGAAWAIGTDTAKEFTDAQSESYFVKLSDKMTLTPPDAIYHYEGNYHFKLFELQPDVYIPGGGKLWNVVSTRGRYKVLEKINLGAELTHQKPGSIFGPAWAPNVDMLYYIIQGSVLVQLVDPISNQRVLDIKVYEGQTFIIPRQFGFVITAGKKGAEHFTVADSSEPTGAFFAGKLSQYHGIPKEILQVAFNVDEKLLNYVLAARNSSYIILPPKENPDYVEDASL